MGLRHHLLFSGDDESESTVLAAEYINDDDPFDYPLRSKIDVLKTLNHVSGNSGALLSVDRANFSVLNHCCL
jgi:hypothetical protein